MIRHLGRADRAEIDRVMVLDLLAAVRRHHEFGLAIHVGAPIELVEAPFDAALALSDCFEDFDASRNDLLADAVAGNDRDLVAPHEDDPLLTSPFGEGGAGPKLQDGANAIASDPLVERNRTPANLCAFSAAAMSMRRLAARSGRAVERPGRL